MVDFEVSGSLLFMFYICSSLTPVWCLGARLLHVRVERIYERTNVGRIVVQYSPLCAQGDCIAIELAAAAAAAAVIVVAFATPLPSSHSSCALNANEKEKKRAGRASKMEKERERERTSESLLLLQLLVGCSFVR